MKNIFSILCLVFLTAIGFGQNKQSEKADKLFGAYQYVDAIDAYLKLINNKQGDGHIYKQLADSYYNVFNIEEASKWYAKALETKQDAETYYHYAQVLKSQGNYDAANKQMDVFSKMMPNDQRAKAHMANPNYIPQLADKSKLFNVKETTINNLKQSDFGAILSNDNIVYFVSTRNTDKKEDSWTNKPYLDIYQSVRTADGKLSEPELVNGLNTPYHDGPLTLSADGNTMIFSRDGHSENSFKKIKDNKVKLAQQGLYKATLVDGKWGNIQPLPFNSTEYSVTHPSLSTDGKTLYFASNMPNGLGDVDIWKVSINGITYGTPTNLGPNVNTAGKEGFPFISNDHILYFSTNGRQGLGGFDIFKINLNKDEDAVNLGKDINTKSDDFSFSINTTKKIGFFSSNRSGADNIYMAIPICQYDLIVLVKDNKTNEFISGADVSVTDDKNNPIATKPSSTAGQASFNFDCETAYLLTISKEGYETLTLSTTVSNGENATVDALITPVDEMITDTEVKLKNIYFEFNKSNITQQGASELDKLVAILNNYPNMSIFIKSHTDSKGSAEYNLKLSEQRAQSTMQYVISKGIAKHRLSAKGLGSSEPKIDCKSNCTEKDDAENRRSEFMIVKK